MPTQKTATLQPIPYLAFNGTCADAMRFYETTLGGTIRSSVTMGEVDKQMGGQTPPEYFDKIVNCQLELPGGVWLYGGDCPPHMPFQGSHGFSLTLNFDTAEEGEDIFNKLSEGGRVNMPYVPTFWSDKFGMVTDKFGINWAINGNLRRG